jgi:hypothetical protein
VRASSFIFALLFGVVVVFGVASAAAATAGAVSTQTDR